jgi:hypothetical protein
VTNVLRLSFLRDKKAHLSHVICHFLLIIAAEFYLDQGSPFYLMPSVIINMFATAFYEILNFKQLELLIIISLIQEI